MAIIQQTALSPLPTMVAAPLTGLQPAQYSVQSADMSFPRKRESSALNFSEPQQTSSLFARAAGRLCEWKDALTEQYTAPLIQHIEGLNRSAHVSPLFAALGMFAGTGAGIIGAGMAFAMMFGVDDVSTPITKEQFYRDGIEARKNIGKLWDLKMNPPLHSYLMVSRMETRQFKRTSAILDELIGLMEQRGLKCEEIVVCVAAHNVEVHTIRMLLGKGVKVISRESSRNQDILIAEFGEQITCGQLILSPFDIKDHPRNLRYHIILWAHPTPPSYEYGYGGRYCAEPGDITPEGMVDNMAQGGVLVTQSDRPKEYVESFKDNPSWFKLWNDYTFEDNYLFASAHLRPRGEIGIFMHIPEKFRD